MSGFTNNLSNLPPGCTDAAIERAQGKRQMSVSAKRVNLLKAVRAERDNWRALAWDLAVYYKDRCKCKEDAACKLCTALGMIDEAYAKEPI